MSKIFHAIFGHPFVLSSFVCQAKWKNVCHAKWKKIHREPASKVPVCTCHHSKVQDEYMQQIQFCHWVKKQNRG